MDGLFFTSLDNGLEEGDLAYLVHLLSFDSHIGIFSDGYPFGTPVALQLVVQHFKLIFEVTTMAVSKKSIIKSSTAKPTAIKAHKSGTASPAAPAGKMVTALRVARNANLAKASGKLAKVTLARSINM
jgi:hypothetical protein